MAHNVPALTTCRRSRQYRSAGERLSMDLAELHEEGERRHVPQGETAQRAKRECVVRRSWPLPTTRRLVDSTSAYEQQPETGR